MWVALPGQCTAATKAALPIPVSVCSVLMCPDTGMAARVGFLKSTQMLMCVIAHGGCNRHHNIAVLKVDNNNNKKNKKKGHESASVLFLASQSDSTH